MQSAHRSRLTLYVPGLFDALMPAPNQGRVTDLPDSLARLLARADRQAWNTTGTETRLFDLFGIPLPALQDEPVAAVTRLIDMGVVDREWWIRADPVNLEATRHGLLLQAGLDLGKEESDQLVAELNQSLAEDGWLLRAPTPQRWYVKPPQAPQITTTPLRHAIGRDIHPLLPRGRDGRLWHTHLNEFQILMHTSPVNVARVARGDLPANSVWFWGGGCLPSTGKAAWNQVASNDPLCLGLARLGSIPATSVPADTEAWVANLPAGGESLMALYVSDVSGDDSAGQPQLVDLWLEPLVSAVHDGTLAEIRLLSDVGPALRYRRAHRWRFWRRLPLASQLRAA